MLLFVISTRHNLSGILLLVIPTFCDTNVKVYLGRCRLWKARFHHLLAVEKNVLQNAKRLQAKREEQMIWNNQWIWLKKLINLCKIEKPCILLCILFLNFFILSLCYFQNSFIGKVLARVQQESVRAVHLFALQVGRDAMADLSDGGVFPNLKFGIIHVLDALTNINFCVQHVEGKIANYLVKNL